MEGEKEKGVPCVVWGDEHELPVSLLSSCIREHLNAKPTVHCILQYSRLPEEQEEGIKRGTK